MMKKVVLGLMLALSAGSLAAAVSDDHAKLKAELAQVGLKVNSVADSVIPGLQQVLTNKGLFFSANQGQFSIEDRDQSTPHIKKVRVVSTVEYYLAD